MKTQPSKSIKPSRPKLKYLVTIEDSEYTTSAYNPEGARSNAAYRYADENDEEVGLIMYQIKHEELYCEVEEM